MSIILIDFFLQGYWEKLYAIKRMLISEKLILTQPKCEETERNYKFKSSSIMLYENLGATWSLY